MSLPVAQLALDGTPAPRSLPDPAETIALYRAVAESLRAAMVAPAELNIAGVLQQADLLAESLEAGRAAALEGFRFYEDAMRVEQLELLRLVEGNRLLREVIQGLLDAHTALLRAQADTDPLAGTDLPRWLRQAQETLHRVPAAPVPTGSIEPADPHPGQPCRRCGQALLWAKTPLGKPVPLNPESAWRYRVLKSPDRVQLVKTWITHFITCPFRDQFKKPKGATP